jgi:hypothetical protein
VAGPVLGFVLDRAAACARPVLGIPGASLPGRPIPFGFDLAAAELSPRQDFALAVAAEDGALKIVELSLAGAAARAVPGAPANADRIVFSPGGGTALVYYAAGGSARVISGLPAAPSVGEAIDLSGLPTAPAALAVSDDGAAVLASTGGDAASLFLMAAGSEARSLPVSGGATLLAFLNSSRDALVAGPGQLGFLQDATGQPSFRILAGTAEGVSAPAGVAVSRDNRRAFVASGDTGALVSVELSSGAVASAACACTVTGMSRFNGDSVFRVSDASDQPMWLFDGGAAEPQMWFVPPESNAPARAAEGEKQ